MKPRKHVAPGVDPDGMKGAIEGDRPDQPQQGNPNAGALDENGLPKETLPICEDAIGANVDNRGREKGVADAAEYPTETGQTEPQPADRGSDG